MKSFLRKYLTEQSSIHGICFIADEKLFKAARIFWFIIFLVSISALSHHGYESYQKWNVRPEIALRINQRHSSDFPFPSISICTPIFTRDNLMNYSKFITAWRLNKLINLTSTEQNYLAANSHICLPTFNKILTSYCTNRTEFNVVKLINESSLELNELFISCSFRHRRSDCDGQFNRILTEYGCCYSFNMQDYNTIFHANILSNDFDSYKRTKTTFWNNYNDSEWSLENGYANNNKENVYPISASNLNKLSLYLYLNDTDSLNICSLFGKMFRIIYHLPNEIPTLLHDEQYLEFGHQKEISLTATSYRYDESLRKFAPAKRGCYFEGEKSLKFFKSYTKVHCVLECIANYTLKQCGCVKFSMPRNQSTPVCDIGNACYYKSMKIMAFNSTKNQVRCDCYPLCNNIKYNVLYDNSGIFENQENLAHVKDLKNGTYSYLNLQFKNYIVEEYESFAAYKFQNFVADVGGFLGLFLGCSLLSLIELIFFLVYSCFKRNKIESNDTERLISRIYSQNEAFHAEQQLQKQEFERLLRKVEILEVQQVQQKLFN